MEWTRKHQNLTSASDNAVFRSNVNKNEQDLPVRQKSNTNEGCNSERRLKLRREARKRRAQSSRGLKKQDRKHRRHSKLNGSEVPADVSVKQPNKQLVGCWIKAKVMLAAMKMIKITTTTQPAKKSTYTTCNFVLRDDVSKDE